ncbi:MAG: Rrf2 family transcriptional regulator [Siculibacillus sp.]
MNACTRGALRILAICARAADAPVTMPDMAPTLAMSEALVVKSCHRLMRAGYIVGVRGRGGGYRLARPAEEITLFEVVELFEDENELFPCRLKADGDCRLAAVCRLRGICAEAWAAFSEVLSSTTIADLATAEAPAGCAAQ